ncbi:M14 family zinc carboxypeptidase [Piscinibacter koreensis]|uniref:Peptidase M14 domain-containing protein n=1 Tax=Piscinibacter koreensis TaxID=2742824 RepID=A0A7Y6NJV5_9BURK|nr:M14 family zinc carboxypeptidase [Schlegelella koreensis]NUZ04421.1 hypothetical protein [Schlegelella koreensis]
MKLGRPLSQLRHARLPLAIAAAFAFTAPAYTQNAEPDNSVYSIVIPYGSSQQLGQLTKLLDHPYVDQKASVVKAEVGADELASVRALGFAPQIDAAETARIQAWVDARTRDLKAGNLSDRKKALSIANGVHSCYRTVEQVYATYDELAAKYPKFVKTKVLGPSWMGTQQQIPPVGTAVPDNSRSSFANLLIKYLPPTIVTRFNLSLFPVNPNPVRAIIVGNFEKQDVAGKAPPPNMVWTGGIHAREYAPQEVGIKFIEWLLENYDKDANARMMLDNNRYHFIVHNPDGRKLAEQDISARQRKNTNYVTAACTTVSNGVTNTLSSGVDLNRNYPFGWATGGAGGSDGNVCGETYRGIGPASEPETQAVMNYVRGTWNQAACRWEGGALPDGRTRPAAYCNPENRLNGNGELDWQSGAPDTYGGGMFVDLHSNARAVLWPWGVERTENNFNTHTPNNKGMAVIAQRMAYHNNYSSQQLLSYNTEGTTKDAFYGYLGAPSYTVEMGRSFYEDCGVFARETYPENFNGFHYVSRVLHRIYQLPFGPDTTNVAVSGPAAKAGDKVTVTATVDDNRYRYSNAGQADILPPPVPVVYNITGAKAYVDKLPWEAGAVGVDMQLSGSTLAKSDFPDATKTATATIDTTGLSAGRHMVYVQGTNADGKPGAVSAQFLDVTAAAAPSTDDDDDGGGSLGVTDLMFALLGMLGLAAARRARRS